MQAKPIALPPRVNDWLWAQVQYETTDKSSAWIAIEISVEPSTLVGRASRQGWTRNKRSVVLSQVTDIVAAATIENRERLAEKRDRELEVIERVNLQMQAQVLAVHRADIRKARDILAKMFTQLTIAGPEDEETGFLEELELRAKVMDKMANSLKTLVLLERQAHGIQGAIEDPDVKQPVTTPEAVAVDRVLNRFADVIGKLKTTGQLADSTVIVTDVEAK